MTKAKRPKPYDPKAPRKPPEQKKLAQLGLRLTTAQLAEIKRRAAESRQSLVDYVIGRALT